MRTSFCFHCWLHHSRLEMPHPSSRLARAFDRTTYSAGNVIVLSLVLILLILQIRQTIGKTWTFFIENCRKERVRPLEDTTTTRIGSTGNICRFHLVMFLVWARDKNKQFVFRRNARLYELSISSPFASLNTLGVEEPIIDQYDLVIARCVEIVFISIFMLFLRFFSRMISLVYGLPSGDSFSAVTITNLKTELLAKLEALSTSAFHQHNVHIIWLHRYIACPINNIGTVLS